MTTRGLYIEPAHARLIHNGSKTIIVKDKFFRLNTDDMALVTTDDQQDKALGMIKLKQPKTITIAEFKRLRNYHKISDDDRRKWWPNAQKLFAYQIGQYYGFRNFRKIDMTAHNDIVSDVKLTTVGQEDFNLKVADFSAKDLSDNRLKNYFRKLCGWHTSKQSKFTEDSIILLGKKIMRELMARKIKFNKTPTSVKLLERLARELPVKDFYMQINHGTESDRGSVVKLEDFLEKWDTMKLFDCAISLVGSLANHRETTGDIDIVIKAEPDSDMFNLVKWRIMRAYPEYENRFHFLSDGKWRGPFTSHVDLADIVAVKKKLEVKDMGAKIPDWKKQTLTSKTEDEVKLYRGFSMLKPIHGRAKEEHYTIDSVVDVVNSKW